MRQTKPENTMINVCTMRVSTTERVSVKVLYIFSFFSNTLFWIGPFKSIMKYLEIKSMAIINKEIN